MQRPLLAPLPVTALRQHDVIVGYGRVGSLLGRHLAGAGRQLVVFDETEAMTQAAQRDGAEVVMGNPPIPKYWPQPTCRRRGGCS